MSYIESANALLSAINHDRFVEIELLHNPDVLFHSFLGPTLRSRGAVGDWHRRFHEQYADCEYTDVEWIERQDSVAARATILAKGYDWRQFEQRVVEVFDFADGGIASRRLYAMQPDCLFEKPAADALKNAGAYPGGSPDQARKTVTGFFGSLMSGDVETAKELLHPKAVLVDGAFGTAVGADAIVRMVGSLPGPSFGQWRLSSVLAGAKDVLVELAIAPGRPRAANWIRVVEDKIILFEAHWMLREIGVLPDAGKRTRHGKQVILPI